MRFRHLDLGHQLPAKLTEVEGPTDNFDGINPAFFYMAVEPKIGVGWKKKTKWMVKIRENPIRIDDLGVPLFLETPI